MTMAWYARACLYIHPDLTSCVPSVVLAFITAGCRWYRDLENRWVGSYSRVKHPAGIWSSPYFDCGFSNHWLITYAAPIIVATTENGSQTGGSSRSSRGTENNAGNDTIGPALEEESVRRMLGVATISINLNRLDMDQCPGDDPLFANTHLCDTANSKVSSLELKSPRWHDDLSNENNVMDCKLSS